MKTQGCKDQDTIRYENITLIRKQVSGGLSKTPSNPDNH